MLQNYNEDIAETTLNSSKAAERSVPRTPHARRPGHES